MKNLIYILFSVSLFISCSKDGPINDDDDVQDYTSYEFVITGSEIIFETMISAYYNTEGKCILLCDHGNHSQGGKTDKFIIPEYIKEIYLFYGYDRGYEYCNGRIEKSFKLTENIHNILTIDETPGGLPVYEKTEYTWPY